MVCTWILAQKFGIPKTQFTDQMMPKKKEEQCMETLVLLRRGKIPTEGDIETKYEAKTEGKTIQRLPPPSDPSHIQLKISDTIIDTHKYLLTGAG